ncbi:MAG: A/G-specific adenine glycosylase [Anaerolineaceae bacterium]
MPEIGALLLAWYDQNARQLPWRSDVTPYRTWVSEIMLQQTRVETVIPYFERFMLRFPDIVSLAQASQAEVLQSWEGLGYYSRARNLHKCAQLLCQQYQCQLPANLDALRELPGIGRYTAGAIASIAFGIPAPALDANIRRVLSRLLELREPAGSPAGEKILWEAAGEFLHRERPGDHNQALMELGALVCTPKAPQCPRCPLRGACLAVRHNSQTELPACKLKSAVPHYIVTAAVIQQGAKVLIAQRPQGGLLGGLWEFPGGKLETSDPDLPACLRREIREELGVEISVGEMMGVFRHAYTHFRITLHAFACALLAGQTVPESETVRWASPEELPGFAMGKVDRLIAKSLLMKAP